MPAAACATSGLPPQTWDAALPREGRRARDRRVAAAKAVCAGCPILAPCGELADARRDIGVWGGKHRPFDAARIPHISRPPTAGEEDGRP